MKRLFIAVWLLWASPVLAQSIGQVQPLPVATLDASGAITTTNTFQQVFAAQTQTPGAGLRYRAGCLIINTSTHTQWIAFGTLTSQATTSAVPLNAATSAGTRGGSWACGEGGVGVVQQRISITGTAADTFTAYQE